MIFLMMIDTAEERRKFVILYEKYRYLLQKVATDILQDSFLAEDAVHEAFMRLTKNMDKVGETDSVATKRYLIAITKNVSIDIYRKRRMQMQKEIYIDELNENAQLSYTETDVENSVLEVLKNLPVKYRDIFLLKYSANLENKEIAKLCGIKEGTLRQRIARGKLMIEEALRKLEDNENGTYSGN
ncbi:MAG: RNA polymerase sigma factor [Clostridiales bacterium]|nr:RNA polymerase sigma factor [Clostridiales bacterium]